MPERLTLPRPLAPNFQTVGQGDGRSEQLTTTQLEYLLQEPRLLLAHTQQAKTVDVKVHQLPHIEKRENFAIGQLERDRFAPVVWIWTPARPLFETVPAPKACQTFFNPNGAAKVLPPPDMMEAWLWVSKVASR